jgi:hypothetical protein
VSEWVEAGHEHQRFLQEFVCAPHPWRKAKKLLLWNFPVNELWATRVQGLIRNLRPALPPPQRLRLRIDSHLGLVESVGCYRVIWNDDGNHVVRLYLLAVHRTLFKRGYGQATLDHVMEEVATASLDRPLTHQVTTVAEVHRNNRSCLSLLSRNGWQFLQMDPDGQHEIWAVVAQ